MRKFVCLCVCGVLVTYLCACQCLMAFATQDKSNDKCRAMSVIVKHGYFESELCSCNNNDINSN